MAAIAVTATLSLLGADVALAGTGHATEVTPTVPLTDGVCETVTPTGAPAGNVSVIVPDLDCFEN